MTSAQYHKPPLYLALDRLREILVILSPAISMPRPLMGESVLYQYFPCLALLNQPCQTPLRPFVNL